MSYFQKRLRGYLGGRKQWVGNPSRHFACRENRANLLRRGRMVSLHATLYTLVSHNIHAQKKHCATSIYSFSPRSPPHKKSILVSSDLPASPTKQKHRAVPARCFCLYYFLAVTTFSRSQHRADAFHGFVPSFSYRYRA